MLKSDYLKLIILTIRSVSTMKTILSETLESTSRFLAPSLSGNLHKGQAGRIGIVGGSLEYTGAPYFAGISALKVGADLIHIFCAKEASTVIKSYSPELIVHPLLDDTFAIEKIEPWLERLHVMVIGPGLGRDTKIFENVEKLISICRKYKKPLVIDADGLFLISTKPDILKDYPGVILTPNAIEFTRLFGEPSKQDICEIGPKIASVFGENCIVIKKGEYDEVHSGSSQANFSVTGSARRCGGQGDLLAGSLAVFYNWALQKNFSDIENNLFAACYSACKLTRECNARAYKRLGRAMTTSDMIEEISGVFKEHFENSQNTY